MDPYEVYVPTSLDLARRKYEFAGIQPGEKVYDLGCGDGLALIPCASEFGAECVCVEVRSELVEQAQENARAAGVADRFEVRCEDYLDSDLSDADVIVIFLTRGSMGPLSIKLEEKLPVGARIVTHMFDLPGWTPEKTEQWVGESGESVELFLYRQVARED